MYNYPLKLEQYRHTGRIRCVDAEGVQVFELTKPSGGDFQSHLDFAQQTLKEYEHRFTGIMKIADPVKGCA